MWSGSYTGSNLIRPVQDPLIRVFMKTQEIVDSGVLMLRLQQAGMMFMAVVLVTTCVFQSAGKAMGAFLLSVSRQGVIYGIVIVIASAYDRISWCVGRTGCF